MRNFLFFPQDFDFSNSDPDTNAKSAADDADPFLAPCANANRRKTVRICEAARDDSNASSTGSSLISASVVVTAKGGKRWRRTIFVGNGEGKGGRKTMVRRYLLYFGYCTKNCLLGGR